MSKIFFVDDDSMMRKVFEKTFRLYGHDILFTENGQEFLTGILSAQEKPDVILLDMMMPNMNGFEVLEKIKKEESIKNIPVICFSNLTGLEDIKKAKGLGATEYIIKSEFTPKQVVDKVQKVVEDSKNKS